MKQKNSTIRLAHECALAFASTDLSITLGLRFFEIGELLAPAARAIENERQKIETGCGGRERLIPGTPAFDRYYERVSELLAIEQEIPPLPVARANLSDLEGVRAAGTQVNALVAIGALVLNT